MTVDEMSFWLTEGSEVLISEGEGANIPITNSDTADLTVIDLVARS